MKNVLIMNENDLDLDSRVLRQLKMLDNRDFKITVLGYNFSKANQFKNVEFLKIPEKKRKKIISLKTFFRTLRLFKYYYFSLDVVINTFEKLRNKKFDVILVNDTFWVPLAWELKKIYNCKLICDAHEYYPLEFEENKEWNKKEKPFKEWIISTFYPKADKIFTVSYSIAQKYKQIYKMEPIVFMNACNYYDLKPVFKTNGKIKLVYHGGAIKSRKIENLIKAMELCKNTELHLYLIGNDEYYKELIELAKKYPHVYIHPPIDSNQLVYELNFYDIGLVYYYPSNFNNKNALPNKFFEYIQARVPVIAVKTPDLEYFVNRYQIGIVLDDCEVESLSKAVNELTFEKINKMKENTNFAAKDLCLEKQKEIFIKEFI